MTKIVSLIVLLVFFVMVSAAIGGGVYLYYPFLGRYTFAALIIASGIVSLIAFISALGGDE